ncbi:MAG: DUF3784 domain-containing protein [Muribaculaceae bacterium]|nr:DUF3784 domain-containing protein [Muribaculaceae bacterium]
MVLLIINIVLIVLCVIVLLGKGDFLIPGYYTASEQEKQKVNIKRLRYVVAGFFFLWAFFLSLPFLFGQDDLVPVVALIGLTVYAIVSINIANTWSKRK